jgi:hypothetical protein
VHRQLWQSEDCLVRAACLEIWQLKNSNHVALRRYAFRLVSRLTVPFCRKNSRTSTLMEVIGSNRGENQMLPPRRPRVVTPLNLGQIWQFLRIHWQSY